MYVTGDFSNIGLSGDFSNIGLSIKKAQARWESKELQDSLKRTCQNCKKLEGEEHKKDNDNIRFVVAKVRVNNSLLKEHSKQLKLLHIKTKYYQEN